MYGANKISDILDEAEDLVLNKNFTYKKMCEVINEKYKESSKRSDEGEGK
ncbi:MAG: hypothetical protein ACRCVJ_12280 [Clostridium sp.]